MSATVQISATKPDVSSPAQSLIASPLGGVGDAVVGAPFAAVFAAVQADEVAPKHSNKVRIITEEASAGKAVTGDKSGEETVDFEQTVLILAPRQNNKTPVKPDGDNNFSVEEWPEFALVTSWETLPESALPIAPDLGNLIDTPILPEEGILELKPAEMAIGISFTEEFAAKISVVEGTVLLAGIPNSDVANIETPIVLTMVEPISDVVTSIDATIVPIVAEAKSQVDIPILQIQGTDTVQMLAAANIGQKIDAKFMPMPTVANIDAVLSTAAKPTLEATFGPFGLVAVEQNPELGTEKRPELVPTAALDGTGQGAPNSAPVGLASSMGPVLSTTAAVTLSITQVDQDGDPIPDPVAEIAVEVPGEEISPSRGDIPQGPQLIDSGKAKESNRLDKVNEPEDIATKLDAPLELKAVEPPSDDASSAHLRAAVARPAAKRVLETANASSDLDASLDDAVSTDSQLDLGISRPASQTALNSAITIPQPGQVTRAIRDASNQRASVQLASTSTSSDTDANADVSLATLPTTGAPTIGSNVTGPAASSALANSAGTAAILDVRRQGWTKTLVNRAAGMAKAGGTMTLSILPQNLGQITLKLSDGRKGLELRMTADVASTTAMLRDVQGQIESAFDDAGLKLGSYSAQTGGQNQQDGSNNNDAQDDTEIEVVERNAQSENTQETIDDPERLNILL